MNERIRRIADEAAKYSATMFLPTGENGDDLFVKKFAELIVQECANYANWYQSNSQYTDIDKAIKEHFGVE